MDVISISLYLYALANSPDQCIYKVHRSESALNRTSEKVDEPTKIERVLFSAIYVIASSSERLFGTARMGTLISFALVTDTIEVESTAFTGSIMFVNMIARIRIMVVSFFKITSHE